MNEDLTPTQSHVIWGGAVEVHCFGTRYGNWSLAGKTPEEAEEKNPGIIERMRRVSERFDCTIFAPNPSTFNAEIVDIDEVREMWILGGLYRGPLADGVLLHAAWEGGRGAAFAVSSGDCPTLVLRDQCSGDVVAAHAGRDSLIETKDREGLAASMLYALGREYGWVGVRGFIACGISSRHFTHPYHDPSKAERNRELHTYAVRYGAGLKNDVSGRIDLPVLIKAQLSAHCVSETGIGQDGTCTFSDFAPGGQSLWFSHRRDKDGQRNLVLVIRRK